MNTPEGRRPGSIRNRGNPAELRQCFTALPARTLDRIDHARMTTAACRQDGEPPMNRFGRTGRRVPPFDRPSGRCDSLAPRFIEHRLHRLFDVKLGRIEHERTFGRTQRRTGAFRIALVALLQFQQKTF